MIAASKSMDGSNPIRICHTRKEKSHTYIYNCGRSVYKEAGAWSGEAGGMGPNHERYSERVNLSPRVQIPWSYTNHPAFGPGRGLNSMYPSSFCGTLTSLLSWDWWTWGRSDSAKTHKVYTRRPCLDSGFYTVCIVGNGIHSGLYHHKASLCFSHVIICSQILHIS